MKKVNQMSIFKDLMLFRKNTEFLKNSAYYFNLLKESEEKEIPLYKLEVAKILNDLDIYFLKIRIIFSVLGIVVSMFLFGLVTFEIFKYIDYESEQFVLIHALYLYLLLFIFLFSYNILKRTLEAMKFLTKFIEE